MAKVDYFEIGTPDPGATKAFYEGVFGWKIEAPTGPANYSMIGAAEGGVWDTSTLGGGAYAVFYINVDDVHATVDKAVSLGASVVIPVTDNGAIFFAHLLDPHGSRIAVWHPKPSSG
ncbi:MAG: glyoxalase/Bleomycin resistance protein/dioxygenase [Frondihabitans sp.]|nr:glyoxalase/Bleomycin resistance protein/dioxygenase [Frondihabitans sp.]